MKNISSKNSSKKPLLIIILLMLCLTVIAFFYFHNKNESNVNKVNYDKPSKNQIDSGNNTKKQTIDEDKKNTDEKSPTINPKTGNVDEPISKPNLSPIVTQITAASVEDGTLYIRNNIEGIYTEGTCTITLRNGNKTVTKTAGIQALPKSTTCKGFNISTGELSPGLWSIELSISINNITGKATAQVEV